MQSPHTLSVPEVDTFRDFEALQGQKLSPEEAEALYAQQQAFIVNALREGFTSLDKLEAGEQVDDSPLKTHIRQIKSLITSLRSQALGPASADQLTAYYNTIHADEKITDRQKLFLEFLLGLAYVDLNIKIGLQTAKIMVNQDQNGRYFDAETQAQITALEISEQTSNVIEGLREPADIAYQLGDKMQQLFDGNAETYWTLVKAALEADPDLEALARKVVSMRHIPQQKEVLGMAQALHWSGWGGDGAALKQVPQLNDPTFLRHVIAWHGEGDQLPHFSKRMKLFADMIIKIKEHEAYLLSGLVSENFSGQETLRIFDAGAGPLAKGSANWLARRLAGDFKSITIDASDVDGASLARLAGLKGQTPPLDGLPDNIKIGDAIRLDLNGAWPDAPKDKYELFVLSITLHQLMDAEMGVQNVAQVLKTATRVTKPGGFIAWSDAGENAHIQSMIIPFNVADREGCVPENIFERISFNDLKVESRKEGDTKFYKIPYRTSFLRHATPQQLALQHETGIYESNAFTVIELPEWVIDQLDGVRTDSSACDMVIKDYLEDKGDELGEKRAEFTALITALEMSDTEALTIRALEDRLSQYLLHDDYFNEITMISFAKMELIKLEVLKPLKHYHHYYNEAKIPIERRRLIFELSDPAAINELDALVDRYNQDLPSIREQADLTALNRFYEEFTALQNKMYT